MAEASSVLIVDDDASARSLLEHLVSRCGATPHVTSNARDARTAIAVQPFACAVIDQHLDGEDGLTVLSELRKQQPRADGIVITAFPTVSCAVDALRLGAIDYVTKPFDTVQLTDRLTSVLERQRLLAERDELKSAAHLERLATLGTLAASVAHDLRSPLSFLQGNLDLALNEVHRLQRLSADASRAQPSTELDATAQRLTQVRAYLDDAAEAMDRVRDIVNDLSFFIRPQTSHVGSADLLRAVESGLRLCGAALPRTVKVVRTLAAVPRVRGDLGPLVQVVVNLVVNAAQALGASDRGGGEIRISTEAAADAVVLTVRDDGPGIPEQVRGRIFDPFFTTKPPELGTGLGLSICQRIVTSFGGRIDVESAPGEGATFRVALQRAP